MALVTFIYLVCAFRTNICFVIVFLALFFTFVFLTVAYWLLAEDYQGNAAAASRFVIVSQPWLHPLLISFPGETRRLTIEPFPDWGSFWFRLLRSRLVDTFRTRPRVCRLPIPATSWRLE